MSVLEIFLFSNWHNAIIIIRWLLA